MRGAGQPVGTVRRPRELALLSVAPRLCRLIWRLHRLVNLVYLVPLPVQDHVLPLLSKGFSRGQRTAHAKRTNHNPTVYTIHSAYRKDITRVTFTMRVIVDL